MQVVSRTVPIWPRACFTWGRGHDGNPTAYPVFIEGGRPKVAPSTWRLTMQADNNIDVFTALESLCVIYACVGEMARVDRFQYPSCGAKRLIFTS